jgi:CheY-like chemotaxis protein
MPSQRVLAIDDDRELIALIGDTLQLLGEYDVQTAMDGALGLEQVENFHPDCIVVDIRMPQLDGFQFVRALRGDPATEAIPIVILSALVQDHEVLSGLLSGADTYLFKPVRLDDLLDAVAKALRVTDDQRLARMQRLAEASEMGE